VRYLEKEGSVKKEQEKFLADDFQIFKNKENSKN
jgi:hypothetical protein